jgi:hypothetical protein
MNMQAINCTKTAVPLYQTTMRYVPEYYNIKMHAKSAHVTPLIIVSNNFLLTAGCAVIFFADSVM